jgi:outer membrane protein assembly factor BamE (lipoprotein component of BamABCDE complex)
VRAFSPRNIVNTVRWYYTAHAAHKRYNIPAMKNIANSHRRRHNLRAPRLAAALALVAALGAAGCVPEVNQRGHVPNPEALALIKPGQQTRDQVLDLLGSPTAIGTFEDTRWYYITRKTEQLAFYAPELVEAKIVMVEFDLAGFVKQVARLSNDDARDIDPVARETPTKGRKLGFFQQILGNIGVGGPPGRR